MLIEVFTSFEEAAATWRATEANGICYGFQSFDWLSIWQQTIGAFHGVKPYIVRVADPAGATAMLIPLGTRKHLGQVCLSFLGGRSTDYHAPVLCCDFPQRVAAADFVGLWKRILDRLPAVDLVSFDKMPRRVGELDNPFVGLPSARRADSAFFTVLDGPLENFRDRWTAKFRNDTRRQERRLAEIGKVSFQVAKTPGEAEFLTSTMIHQKASWYRETGISNMFETPAYGAFYTRMAVDQIESGLIHVSALLVNDQVVATHWGMLHRDRFYWLMPAYESGPWAKYSTGRLILERLVEWCFANGVAVFDFTGGNEAYKARWADGTMGLFDLRQAQTLRGLPAVGVARTLAGVKAWTRHYPGLYAALRQVRRCFRRHVDLGRRAFGQRFRRIHQP